MFRTGLDAHLRSPHLPTRSFEDENRLTHDPTDSDGPEFLKSEGWAPRGRHSREEPKSVTLLRCML